MGRISDANRVLEELIRKSSQSYGLYYGIALLYFYLGDKDNGFTYLDRSYKEHENSIVTLKIDEHIADNIRADPRFKAFLKKMNLG